MNTLRDNGKWPKEAVAARKGSNIDATAPEKNIMLRRVGVTDRSDV